ncbi:cyclase [Mycobacterium sp. MBM]|nr:cyclase [Mycobacterium sp. MBM]
MSGLAVGFEHDDVDTVVVFVDMAGFTALTNVHGDHHAARLASDFAEVAETLLEPGDWVVKTIGDALMITSTDAVSALRLLLRLNEVTRGSSGFPLLRAGMSAGTVVQRRGDVFGSTVNIAARLADIAESGQIVASITAVSQLRDGAEPEAVALGPLSLRNIEVPVEAFVLDVGSSHREHVDPMCRMHVGSGTPKWAISVGGVSYRFCSLACLRQYERRTSLA